MTVRSLCERDIDGMVKIERECFSLPWSRESFGSAFEGDHTVFFGVFEGERIIAYAGMQHFYGDGAVTNVATLPEFRRMGAGKKLLCVLLDFAENQGISTVSLEVRVSNAAAIAMYEKMGFVSLGIRKGFYSSPKEDALIMQKNVKG